MINLSLINADANRTTKSNQCIVKLIKVYHTLSEKVLAYERSKKKTALSYRITFKFNVKSDSGAEHVVFVQLDPDYNCTIRDSNALKVYCDCNDFKFRSAYTLNKSDGLFKNERINISLDKALTITPTRGISLACKHVQAVLNYIKTDYESLMKQI